MADLLIKGMEMPDKLHTISTCRDADGVLQANCGDGTGWHDVVEVPTHGRLIDAGELRAAMYHNAFEKDSDMQRWDSGCWIRYKMFEKVIEAAPTVIEASEVEE